MKEKKNHLQVYKFYWSLLVLETSIAIFCTSQFHYEVTWPIIQELPWNFSRWHYSASNQ
jgi:hypothetical protein